MEVSFEDTVFDSTETIDFEFNIPLTFYPVHKGEGVYFYKV